jgi:antitoxin ParD1/3/4
MKDDKSELENDMNCHDRGKQKELDWIRDKLIKAEKSGFTEMTREEILAQSKKNSAEMGKYRLTEDAIVDL